jgi:hypothetical protein
VRLNYLTSGHVQKLVTKEKRKVQLRSKIKRSLRKQGYELNRNEIKLPPDVDKNAFRDLHSIAVRHKLDTSKDKLAKIEDRLLSRIANGSEVSPELFDPKLVQVIPGTEEELLFRYVSLHWSIPVSSGYGRRLRFLVFDQSNGKLVGALGLGDPVYSLKARDEFIGWDSETKKRMLYHVMDAYVLGAVPPYSQLLCGKLMALLATSNEVRKAFKKRYFNSESLINRITRPPYLALITSTSALGRSSLYNRIKIEGFEYWKSVGFTIGSGEFHFSNGLYSSIRGFVDDYCDPTAKQKAWGTGFRNKREVIRKCLSNIGLSSDLLFHGVKREIFVAPLGENALRFLRGETKRTRPYDWSEEGLTNLFKERWFIPRSQRMQDYKTFDRETYRLWPKK